MDIDLQQRQVLNLFEQVAKPFTAYPDITFDPYDISFPTSVGDEDNFTNIQGEEGTATNSINLSDLALAKSIPRGKLFSSFHPGNREAAYALARIFKSVSTLKEMIDLAASIRDQVNEHVFVFAWSAALVQRPDARLLRAPPIWEVFPDKFIECTVLGQALDRAQAAIRDGSLSFSNEPIVINRNFAATDRATENRLSYFREDMGINSHHWHWHLIYPVEGDNPRDRRGELFYYMHQQILARYDAERIANGLARVTSLHEWNQPIAEAYFPKLTTANGAINWGSRPSGLVLQDINIPDEGSELGIQFQIHDLERWRTRILHAIHSGSVIKENGDMMPLDEETGTNILGELIEASNWSANKLLYGDMHNFGHYALCYIHDPDRSYSENMGVMGDSVTAMRDPIFYRWHKFIDSLFQQFKATLEPYTGNQLLMANVTLDSINLHDSQEEWTPPSNLITTGWQESLVELSRGLDFSSRNPVQARVTHLQHKDFFYHIKVTNSSTETQEVVFRIFIAPNNDAAGRRFSFREQRLLMIEMDKFVSKIEPGTSVIKRSSNDSSVTIPFERTFRDLETPSSITPLAPGGVPTDSPTDAQTNFCGCGWPDHFLVPRGLPQPGMPFTLFAMATNWREDRVLNETNGHADGGKFCRNAASYCGVLDEKYPDKKPMGFPFDRPPEKRITTLAQFVALSPNMTSNDIRIQFQDEIISYYP